MAADSLASLLACLADGGLHSGESLGAELGVSRAAVWKQVRLAKALGVPLLAIKGEGYRLQPGFELLNATRIQQACQQRTRMLCPHIETLLVTDSTNSEVVRRFNAEAGQGFAILAEKQTAGRGRRGRSWHSPFGASIYLSIGWVAHEGISAFEGLSLVAGLKVVKALERFGVKDLMLKWPNDVYWKQQKLAGILVDVQGDPAGVCQLAVGIGINVDLPAEANDSIDQPWIDLRSISQSLISRNQLVAAVLDEMMPTFADLADRGFVAYRDDWQRYDLCQGHQLVLQHGQHSVTGVGYGINTQGAYGIRQPSSGDSEAIHYFSGGEISMRIKQTVLESPHADS